MDTFQALLKLILDEKSLTDIKSKVNKELKVKVGADTSEISKNVSDLARLTKAKTMETWADNNSKAMKRYGSEINNIINKLGNLGSDLPKKEFDDLDKRFKLIQDQATKTGDVGKTFGEKMKTSWQKIKEGVQFVKELDNTLTDISDLSGTQLKNLGSSAVGITKDLSASSKNFGRPKMFGLKSLMF